MSKNFELLHEITNEKELFETLDGSEDLPETAARDGEPSLDADGKKPDTAASATGLPDVFQTIRQTLGSLGPFVPDLARGRKPVREPIEARGGGKAQDKMLGERFPISRNSVTRLHSALDTPTRTAPKIGPEAEFGNEAAAESEPEALQNIAVPETLPRPKKARISGPGVATGEERLPVNDPEAPEAPDSGKARRKLSHPEPPAGSGIGESKPSGETHGRKVQARGVYKDTRRELLAREEELKLVERVFLGAHQDSPRIALFSGLEHEGGCARICVRTGEILASQAEGAVCLVDADFDAPSLHEYFGVRNEKGLAEATRESAPIQEFAQQLSPANLWLLACGDGASRLNLAKTADRLRARLEELRHAYRYAIVRSGPLGLNANALMFSKWTDGVVLILEANRTRRDSARRIKESLAAAHAKVLGVVLNNRSYPIPEPLYSRL